MDAPEHASLDCPALPTSIMGSFSRITAAAEIVANDRGVAVETPIAIEVNGLGYAVLMASPGDLEDLVAGFLLTERLISAIDDIMDLSVTAVEKGIIARASLVPALTDAVLVRVRHRISESSCGLCGIENLEQAMRPLPHVSSHSAATDSAVFTALSLLRAHQTLNQITGAVHAAAACSASGDILLVREDVGRHNAFDKLIGAMLRQGRSWEDGFALLSSRCSYELVEKAVLSDCPMLVTISAPTRLAIARAEASGLALRVLARPDAYLIPVIPPPRP